MRSTSFLYLYNDIIVAAATVLYHGGKKLGMECKQNRIKVTYEMCMVIIRLRK
jgi:hypothetical protein